MFILLCFYIRNSSILKLVNYWLSSLLIMLIQKEKFSGLLPRDPLFLCHLKKLMRIIKNSFLLLLKYFIQLSLFRKMYLTKKWLSIYRVWKFQEKKYKLKIKIERTLLMRSKKSLNLIQKMNHEFKNYFKNWNNYLKINPWKFKKLILKKMMTKMDTLISFLSIPTSEPSITQFNQPQDIKSNSKQVELLQLLPLQRQWFAVQLWLKFTNKCSKFQLLKLEIFSAT